MLQVEIKKIVFHQKWLLLLLLSLAFYAVLCTVGGYDSSYVIDRNEDTYLAYINRWQGKVTEEKSKEMESEYEEVIQNNDAKKNVFLTV